MRNIERGCMVRHISVEAEWDEKLQVIRQTVREIGKDADIDTVGRDRLPRVKSGARDFLSWQSRLVVADIGGADGDRMSALCEASRQRVYDARDAAVRPRVLEIRRDVQDPE